MLSWEVMTVFYAKLAWNNLRQSKQIYGPFLLTSLVLFMTLCSTFSILYSPISKNMSYGKMILGFGAVVLVLLAVILISYSYRFVLKQRSKEFGLYNILGMNKRQITFVSSIEILIVFLGIVALGSLLAAIFSNVLYLVFVNLIHYDKLVLAFSLIPFALTTIIFVGISILLLLYNALAIRRTSPLDLFRTVAKAEKEPKGNTFLAILSLLFLGAGYGLAVTSTKIAPLALIYRFLIAVIVVILGTYLFYISFTTWYLKKKRRHKSYYYQPEHFITVSQMIFRMKQNALGLANITILAVMSFVTIATTASLFGNTEVLVNSRFPKNTELTFEQIGNQADVKSFAQENILPEFKTLNVTDIMAYKSVMISMPITQDKGITVNEESFSGSNVLKIGYVYVIQQNDFKRFGNKIPHLKDNQVAFFKQKGDSKLQTLTVFGKKYNVVKNLRSVTMPDVANTYNPGVLVVSNPKQMATIKQSFDHLTGFQHYEFCKFFANLNEQDYQKLVDKKGKWLTKTGETLEFDLARKTVYRDEAYSLFGGFLFTGLLLGVAFLMTAALIIYYKRYSEGVEDQKSYHILQEVGMSSGQIKRIIRSQTLMVFFMPLAMALCHFLLALIMLKQMLLLFGVTNDNLVYQISGTVIIVIIALYYGIYRLTGQTYYKLIEK